MQIKSLAVSHSSMSMFHSCARKLEFRKFYMHPGRDRSLPADAGSALHVGYQAYLVSRNKEEALAKMALAYPIDLCDNPMWARSLESCVATLEAMMSADNLIEYELAHVDCIDGVNRPAVEVFFKINIKNFSLSDTEEVPVSYVGFIDAILYNHLLDEYIVCDIKTHADRHDDLTAKYALSGQCMPYGIVLERMLEQQLEQMVVKYLSVKIDILEPKVALYSFDKTQQDIQDWAKGLLVDLQQLKLFYNMQWLPRNGENCFGWGKPCNFFDVCESRDEDYIQAMILSNKQPYTTRDDPVWIECDLDLGI